MGSFNDWLGAKLERLGLRPKCAACGNPHLGELAVGFTGEIHCRQDIPAIRDSCDKRIGWRVLDPNGKVISRGPGMTFRATGNWEQVK